MKRIGSKETPLDDCPTDEILDESLLDRALAAIGRTQELGYTTSAINACMHSIERAVSVLPAPYWESLDHRTTIRQFLEHRRSAAAMNYLTAQWATLRSR